MTAAPPTSVEAFQQAVALHQRGMFEDAKRLYEGVLNRDPHHVDALHLLGVLAAQTQDPASAVSLIGRALQLRPDHAFAHCNLGSALQDLDRWDDALASFERAIRVDPAFVGAHMHRARLLRKLGRSSAALDGFERVLALAPEDPEIRYQRATLLHEMGRFTDAIAEYDGILARHPQRAEVHSSRGLALRSLGLWSEALASLNLSVTLDTSVAETHFNRATVLYELNRLEAARNDYRRAIALNPMFADAHFNEALAALASGDFELGWQGFEWRWAGRGGRRGPLPDASARLWLGAEPLAGKSIVLYCEHGLGDTLQFVRYASVLAQRGATVTLSVQAPLVALLRSLEGPAEVLAQDHPLPPVDYQCPLMSLPLACGTRLHSVPAPLRYVQSDNLRVQRWQEHLGPRTKPRIGLAWSGNPRNKNDGARSIPLGELIGWLPRDYEWIGLQKDVRERDRAVLEAAPHIRDASRELEDFNDTAALIDCLDLVLTVDTSVAHLAGALGRPTWLLLAFSPDWRWLLDRDDSPWYPSVQLYRQRGIGDWAGVLERVGHDLAARFNRA